MPLYSDIDTDHQRDQANKLSPLLDDLAEISNQIRNLPCSVSGLYDGQLEKIVSDSLSGMHQQVSNIDETLSDIIMRINTLADDIDDAMTNGSISNNFSASSIEFISEKTRSYYQAFSWRIKVTTLDDNLIPLPYFLSPAVITYIGPFWSGESYPGQNPTLIVPTEIIRSNPTDPNDPLYLYISQGQDPWGNDDMGVKGHKLSRWGCFVTSVSIIGRMHGIAVSPRDVNNYLKTNNGYTPGTSYLNFKTALDSLSKKSDLEFSYRKTNDVNDLNASIANGDDVIIHVKTAFPDGHWVVATGMNSNSEYTVIDPETGVESTYTEGDLFNDTDHRIISSN